MAARKFKAKEMVDLRNKSKAELLEQVEKLKEDLHQLRVAQVSGGAPAKVATIKVTRKNIARIYTIISQITKDKVREEYARTGKLLPLDLRPKLTRKKRLELPKHLKNKKTPRVLRRMAKYPNRKFAVINRHIRLPEDVVKANIKAALSMRSEGKYRQYILRKQSALRFMKKNVSAGKRMRRSRAKDAKKQAKGAGDA